MALAEPNHIKRNLQHTKCLRNVFFRHTNCNPMNPIMFSKFVIIMYQRELRNDLCFYLLPDGENGFNARLITYSGNLVFGFLSLRLLNFLYDVFCLQGKMGKTK